MQFKRVTLLAAVVLACTVVSARASSLTVDNTGVDSGGVNLVSPGAAASFWTLLSEPSGATEALGSGTFRYHNPAYFADTAAAAWVSMDPSGNASVNGVFVYHMSVDLTGFNLSAVSIQGVFGTDNDGFIRVNGGPNVATTSFAAFGAPTSFSITSGFVAGMNSIEIGVDNGNNPTAFFVQFTSATGTPGTGGPVAPEPASLLLLGTGLGALVARARRRQ